MSTEGKEPSARVALAREMMLMLREFRFPSEDSDYEGILECDVRELAQGAAALIESTASVEEKDVVALQIRISNLEFMNDNLRTNNAALRAALAEKEQS